MLLTPWVVVVVVNAQASLGKLCRRAVARAVDTHLALDLVYSGPRTWAHGTFFKGGRCRSRSRLPSGEEGFWPTPKLDFQQDLLPGFEFC